MPPQSRIPARALLISLLLISAVGSAPAETPAETEAPAETSHHARPRVGLVLSGGGARGAAHVGVLRALEELRVPVDAIAGTSLGAVVGALSAEGMSPRRSSRR